MLELLEHDFIIEEEQPALDISMPRVFRRPAAPAFSRGNGSVARLITQAGQAQEAADAPGLGKIYGELTAKFQPGIDWAFSCWEFLLSTEGCRFLPRTAEEKQLYRGDYRVFTQSDFRRLVYHSFKKCLAGYLEERPTARFDWYLQQTYWLTILKSYRALAEPADPQQRRLTAYSYLRCAPYQFLNRYHHERVCKIVERLPFPQRQAVDLYHLNFLKEEAAASTAGITPHAFRRRRIQALRAVGSEDTLSCVLLNQIERY